MKNTVKKVLALAMVVISLLTLCSCTSNKDKNENSDVIFDDQTFDSNEVDLFADFENYIRWLDIAGGDMPNGMGASYSNDNVKTEFFNERIYINGYIGVAIFFPDTHFSHQGDFALQGTNDGDTLQISYKDEVLGTCRFELTNELPDGTYFSKGDVLHFEVKGIEFLEERGLSAAYTSKDIVVPYGIDMITQKEQITPQMLEQADGIAKSTIKKLENRDNVTCTYEYKTSAEYFLVHTNNEYNCLSKIAVVYFVDFNAYKDGELANSEKIYMIVNLNNPADYGDNTMILLREPNVTSRDTIEEWIEYLEMNGQTVEKI